MVSRFRINQLPTTNLCLRVRLRGSTPLDLAFKVAVSSLSTTFQGQTHFVRSSEFGSGEIATKGALCHGRDHPKKHTWRRDPNEDELSPNTNTEAIVAGLHHYHRTKPRDRAAL